MVATCAGGNEDLVTRGPQAGWPLDELMPGLHVL